MPAPDSTSPAPKKLYVAVPLEALADTLMDGIAPSTLYASEKTARKHASTKPKKTAIVTVRARDAEREGMTFQSADGGWTPSGTIEPHLLRCSDDPALKRVGAKRKRSAGGLIVSSLDSPSVLLMYRIHGDAEAWKTPKGGIERGESKRAAARREVAEESGITRVKVVAPLGDVQYFKREKGRLREKTVHLYLMVNRDGETGIAPREGERFVSSEWLPFDEAVERVTQKQVRPIIAKAEKLLAGAKS